MRTLLPALDYAGYCAEWDSVSRAGYAAYNVDTWAAGRRYLSLTALALTQAEVAQLRNVTRDFSRLLSLAVDGILDDAEWWSALAWPWAAIELARQEPPHPDGRATLFGRFDCLVDQDGVWKVIEYNADTPSGGREAVGLEPAIARLHPLLRRLRCGLDSRLASSLIQRIRQHPGPVKMVGVVSTHRWLEDIAQANWLAAILCRAGQPALVGDVNDLAVTPGGVLLRGHPIDALYRFYPVERLYRHAIFAGLWEACIDGRLLLLNGLRGFMAQSKACLAWLYAKRSTLSASDRDVVERHLPETVMARDASAATLVKDGVVKHVNGREGDSVVFGESLDSAAWEARLLEGGYVVQRRVRAQAVDDVNVDDMRHEVRRVKGRYACVGAFSVGGAFGGCYTRIDGPITSSRATYVATLADLEPDA